MTSFTASNVIPRAGSLSAAESCAAQHEIAGLTAGRQGLVWVEYRPEDGGNRLVRLYQGQRQVLTPPGFSVRSRVHEYGGGAFCLAGDRILFVNEADQQIWLQPLPSCRSDGECSAFAPIRLTHTPDTRYGDLLHDPHRRRVIAVAEKHPDMGLQHVPGHKTCALDAVENFLVAVSLHSAAVQVLARGMDFYSSPCLSPQGNQLAWLAWNHPHQPWTQSQLYRAQLDRAGFCLETVQLHLAVEGEEPADTEDESLFQPGFDRAGVLHVVSDRSGWWNLYRLRQEKSTEKARQGLWHNVCPLAAEFGVAQWQLGLKTWGRLENGSYACALVDQGRGRLISLGRLAAPGTASGEAPVELGTEFSLFRSVCAFEDRLYCLAQAPDRRVAVLSIDPHSGATQVLAGGERPECEVAYPQPFSCTVPGNEQVHGFLYRPGASAAQPVKAVPPLLIMTHGGPTATSYPVYRDALQYWTGQGFAVLDLNYRGSAGYGRAYRHRLAGHWGLSDVEDVASSIAALAQRGLIDARQVCIRGNSAGGYTTLSVLSALEGLCAGASLYGVSDPLSLTRVTHKFESRYLDWLIGDPDEVPERYQARSPLANAANIQAPVIFFQGMQDKVVLPDQTLRMADALKARGIPAELHLFEDEGHGFRQLDNQVKVLECELAFYRRHL